MSENLLNLKSLEELSLEADEILQGGDHKKLRIFFDSLLEIEENFESLVDEARFYYILGNCAQILYSYQILDWFSDELTKAVIFFRKALFAIRRIDFLTDEEEYLQSCIETNLGNSLSSQGRAFCCIPFWDNAFKCKQNPVPILSKANHELLLASYVYDPGHRDYHYFNAFELIQLGKENLAQFDPEHKVAYSDDSYFMKFKTWFEDNYKIEDFAYFESYKMEFESREAKNYLKWCGDNRLFINDLNDVSMSEIVYQDIMALPSITQKINPTLSMYEGLMYHGNYDELKNDYCYARYLTFSAKDIPDGHTHFFNNTYPHVDDMAYSITNLKANHYKTAFRILYSLFDKIAYFINRFFELNDIKYDHKISFESIFREIGNSNNWKPHNKLKDSQNYFIHALFYILKDIRDVKGSTPVSRWLDPDLKAFHEIRNAIEHRSLKIVDDFGHFLTQSDKSYRGSELEKLNVDIENYYEQLKELDREIELAKNLKNNALVVELEINKQILDNKLGLARSKVSDQQKLSSHSVVIKVSDFETRLMTLMRLARNSIMYLSLAIHLEEQNKPDSDKLVLLRKVPLKN